MEYITNEFIWAAWLSWTFPFVGAVLTPLFAKIHPRVRDYGAVAFSLMAVVMTVMMVPYLLTGQHFHNQVEWIVLPEAPVLKELKAGVIVDPLSIIMSNVVSIISFLIMVYSLGYMRGDPSLTRYWFFMNFFIGCMLLLVMSDNIIQLLFGWEGVGLCSYALIGFWHRDAKEDWLKSWVGEKPEAYPPSHCGMKAFVTTRIGDLFFMMGAFIILAFAGTLNFVELQGGAILNVPMWALIPAAVLLFGGPIGKSAQLPLMDWLPDAMAGPATVSALIHAATMVKAGVYLVGRIFPIFYIATWVAGSPNELLTFFLVVAWVGAITAFIAGTQGMVSTEIKKVLAYSTVSQIGYMMLALGVAGSTAEFFIGYAGGVFHLMSHAMFKAALFLTAGAVIHACESRFMYHMGGIKRYMPVTFWCMSLAAFSLMGVPLLFSGFWSKDMVLEASLLAGQNGLFIVGALTVAVTSFYTVRMLGLTFFGGKSKHLHELEREGHRVHEAPKVMWIPFTLLVGGTVAFGVMGSYAKDWLEHTFHEYLGGVLLGGGLHVAEAATTHSLTAEAAVWTTVAVSVSMLLAGAIPAYYLYVRRRYDPARITGYSVYLRAIWRFLIDRWYINRFFYKAVAYPIIDAGRWSLSKVELGGIDKFNYKLANATRSLSSSFRRTHTGFLTYNVVLIVVGFAVLFLLLVWAAGV